jgi:hypothetical protein
LAHCGWHRLCCSNKAGLEQLRRCPSLFDSTTDQLWDEGLSPKRSSSSGSGFGGTIQLRDEELSHKRWVPQVLPPAIHICVHRGHKLCEGKDIANAPWSPNSVRV